MADLTSTICGIESPNPFWIASAPPANSLRQVANAFDIGWGGVVWKTIGPPVMDTCNRYGGFDYNGEKLVGLNNIELISDRPFDVNLEEIAWIKKNYPKHAVIVSLMVESEREAWHEAVKKAEATGADGFELNFGCPHGMSERGMGSAVGQVPEYVQMITEWVKEAATIPVLVKLTPNVTNIEVTALAAKQGGADGISAINTINSIIGVDLDNWHIQPSVQGKGTHGGYAGAAVKPIALHMVSSIAHNPDVNLPISAIGGVTNWKDATEFLLLGGSNVQVCTAIMHHGFRIVEEMTSGLSNYLDSRGIASVQDIVGALVKDVSSFEHLNLNYQTHALVDESLCIGCGKCIVSCRDSEVDCISWTETGIPSAVLNGASPEKRRVAHVDETECIGCDLCSIVCPVDNCITMVEVDNGRPPVTWNQVVSTIGNPGSVSSCDVTWDNFLDGINDLNVESPAHKHSPSQVPSPSGA
jgi:dihydropyrimidine dehydrogenase (NAD+) subunit PreA